ncbi:hypothetical protein OHA63_37040 [Streptomyces anulatus]|uniref:hypothetical protein n=1 Tax=Streptomyces anulatus TaxID=1892 RepID=UPI002E358217|nr:hypothetical protein [Streptomyces anulatus]
MLPKIDLPDLLFEVNAWTGFLDAFGTSGRHDPDEGLGHLGGRAAGSKDKLPARARSRAIVVFPTPTDPTGWRI